MPTSNYDTFERWIDSVLCGTNVTYNRQANTITVKKSVSPFEIQSVLSNRKKNAFTVVWTDGTHTTVHCQPGDKWDDEKALAMCFTKKALGNKGNFNDKFNDALDNKMKTIHTPESAKETVLAGPCHYTNKPEKACKCDGTCEVCECKGESEVTAEAEKFIEEIEALKKRKNAFGINTQTATELSKAANKANVALKEMINALTNENTSKTNKVEKTPLYRVFTRIKGTLIHENDFTSIEALRECVHEIAEELYGRKPYYYRTWIGDNGRMQIDFGHYTQFIEVEGITPDEYAKN
jgi:hypothetical protein